MTINREVKSDRNETGVTDRKNRVVMKMAGKT